MQINLAIYITLVQTINDSDLKGVTQNLRTETAPSTASGPLSTASDKDHTSPTQPKCNLCPDQHWAEMCLTETEKEHQQQKQH